MEMGDASSAIGFYQEALLRNPNNAMLQENLSKAMAILKSIEVSKNVFSLFSFYRNLLLIVSLTGY